jgi:Flp pilus assembly protein CpaB
VSSRRTLILIAAIAVGVFAGFALLNYVRGIENDVYEDAQPVEVLIATADIPAGTPSAEALKSVEVTDIPLSIRPATFVSPGNEDSIAGLVSLSDIPANQIIVNGLFVDPTVVATSFKDQVPSGQVAMSVSVASVRGVGGYLQPGDEVNILINHDDGACSAPEGEDDIDGNPLEGLESLGDLEYCTLKSPARYLFQRVEILAIGARQTLRPGETGDATVTPQGGIITFMVPPEAAQLIASVPAEAIYLTLLPEDYEAHPLPALTIDVIEGPTPAEVGSCLTPYGAGGFIEGDLTSEVATTEDGPTDHFSCATIWEG